MSLNKAGIFKGTELPEPFHAEHLLVWSWRRLATGRFHCAFTEQKFRETCGEDASEVFATFCTFLRTLAYSARRRIVIGHPGCEVLTVDEQRVLGLLAAAQAGFSVLFEAHLCWLARIEFRHILTIGAGALVDALSVNYLYLPYPDTSPPPGVAALKRDVCSNRVAGQNRV